MDDGAGPGVPRLGAAELVDQRRDDAGVGVGGPGAVDDGDALDARHRRRAVERGEALARHHGQGYWSGLHPRPANKSARVTSASSTARSSIEGPPDCAAIPT